MTFSSILSSEEIYNRLQINTQPYHQHAYRDMESHDLVMSKVFGNVFTLYPRFGLTNDLPRKLMFLRFLVSPMVFWGKIRENTDGSKIEGIFFWDLWMIILYIASPVIYLSFLLLNHTTFRNLCSNMIGLLFVMSVSLLISLFINIFGNEYTENKQKVLLFIENNLLN